MMCFKTAILMALVASCVNPSVAEDTAAAATGTNGQLLARASATLNDINLQAQAMQAELSKKQAQHRAQLTAARNEYVKQLDTQEQSNSALLAEIGALVDKVQLARQGNKELRTKSTQIQKGNQILRKTLMRFVPSVHTAKEFLEQSLLPTSSAAALKVLEPSTPEPTLDHFLAVARLDDSAPADHVSLLELSGNTEERDIELQHLETLLGEVQQMQMEETSKLKASFLANFEVGEQKRKELAGKKEWLNATFFSLKDEEKQLHTAEAHLANTRAELQRRISGMRIFVRRATKDVESAFQAADDAAAGKDEQSVSVGPVKRTNKLQAAAQRFRSRLPLLRRRVRFPPKSKQSEQH